MKLLLLIVSVIAIFTADCRDFPDVSDSADGTQNLPSESETQDLTVINDPKNKDSAYKKYQVLVELESQDSDNDENQLKTRNLVAADGPEGLESSEEESSEESSSEEESSEEEKEGPNGRKIRRSKCKARNACVVMAGFCVTNATLCSGRLVPEGCKGMNCQCCVPGTFENKIYDLENEIYSLQTNLNGNQLNMNMTLKLMEDKIMDSISNISSKLDYYMEHAVTTSPSPITTAAPTTSPPVTTSPSPITTAAPTTSPPGCPEGFLTTAGSRQCFKHFNVTHLSWTSAKAKCQTEGLMMAKPNDAVGLKTLINNLSWNTWIGGRGGGSYFKWDRDGQQISNSNSLWQSGQPGSKVSTSYCLAFQAGGSANQPYMSFSCSNARPFVCERVMN